MTYCIKPSRTPLINPFWDVLFDTEGKETNAFSMRTDIEENEKEYLFSVELPGVKKEDIDINFVDGYLAISARVERKANSDNKALCRERYRGNFSRRFYLGEVEEEAINATFEDGVLDITVPKKVPEEAKPRKIEIK